MNKKVFNQATKDLLKVFRAVKLNHANEYIENRYEGVVQYFKEKGWRIDETVTKESVVTYCRVYKQQNSGLWSPMLEAKPQFLVGKEERKFMSETDLERLQAGKEDEDFDFNEEEIYDIKESVNFDFLLKLSDNDRQLIFNIYNDDGNVSVYRISNYNEGIVELNSTYEEKHYVVPGMHSLDEHFVFLLNSYANLSLEDEDILDNFFQYLLLTQYNNTKRQINNIQSFLSKF